MTEHDVRSLSLEAFLERLGSADPTPGGGTGAAVAGALGASLVRMLAALSRGRGGDERHEALMQAVHEQAAEAQQALLDLAAEDATAFDAVIRALHMPRGTVPEASARREAVQASFKAACEVPLRVMEHCLEVIGLAKNAVLSGNRNAVPDGAGGAELARAALKCASYSVKANLGAIEDPGYVNATRTRVDEMYYMGTAAANSIDAHVHDLWRPASTPATEDL